MPKKSEKRVKLLEKHTIKDTDEILEPPGPDINCSTVIIADDSTQKSEAQIKPCNEQKDNLVEAEVQN